MPSSLPTEILLLILNNLPKSDRLTLCLTSKRFAEIAQPSLFRRFSLRDPVQVIKCSLVAVARPDLALVARVVFVSFQDPGDPVPICFWKLFARGMTSMSNIVSLHFSGTIIPDILFREVTLPRLQKFTCMIYIMPDISGFLNRHHTITQLVIGGGISAPILDIKQEFLPSLNCFMGSSWVAEKVIPGRPVTSITLPWITFIDEERTMNIFKSFSLSSGPVEFFCATLHIKNNQIPLLKAIAKYLPHLRSLRLNSFSSMGFLDPKFVETLLTALPCFKRLERLLLPSLLWKNHRFFAYDKSLQSQESKLITEWKKICPNLIHITFPSCSMYNFDASSKVWRQTETTLSQTTSVSVNQWF